MSIEADIRKYHEYSVGEDKILRFVIKDGDEVIVDISGWALEWTMRLQPDSAALLTKTIGDGITITNGGAGICEVTIADTDTDDLTARRYEHALWRTDTGNEQKLAHGQVDLKAH